MRILCGYFSSPIWTLWAGPLDIKCCLLATFWLDKVIWSLEYKSILWDTMFSCHLLLCCHWGQKITNLSREYFSELSGFNSNILSLIKASLTLLGFSKLSHILTITSACFTFSTYYNMLLICLFVYTVIPYLQLHSSLDIRKVSLIVN